MGVDGRVGGLTGGHGHLESSQTIDNEVGLKSSEIHNVKGSEGVLKLTKMHIKDKEGVLKSAKRQIKDNESGLKSAKTQIIDFESGLKSVKMQLLNTHIKNGPQELNSSDIVTSNRLTEPPSEVSPATGPREGLSPTTTSLIREDQIQSSSRHIIPNKNLNDRQDNTNKSSLVDSLSTLLQQDSISQLHKAPERPCGKLLDPPMHYIHPQRSMGVRGWFRGLSFVVLWYGSILMGFFGLCCPVLPLIFVSPRTFRRATEVIFTAWEAFAVALLELVYGVKVFISGDTLRTQERSIVLLNHRNRLDWNFLWTALAHASSPAAHNLKMVLKSGIRKIPGIGWVMQMACYLYIHRRWEEDQPLMNDILDYFGDIDLTFQILLFPEGTNLTEETLARSHSFAQSAGLPRLNHVLHPRTTGFCHLVHKLRTGNQLDAVYDITVAYPKTMPVTELDVVRGLMPDEVHFHIQRHDVRNLPSSHAGTRAWLQKEWWAKEALLKETYFLGHFPGQGAEVAHPPLNASYLACFFWIPFTVCVGYLLATWLPMQLWALFHVILFTAISFFTEGLQHFEVWISNFKRRNTNSKCMKKQD